LCVGGSLTAYKTFVAAILQLGSRGDEEDAVERFAGTMAQLRESGLLPPPDSRGAG
jgi:hypothetical protein